MVWCVRGILLVTVAFVNSESTLMAKVHKGIPVKIQKYAHSVFISVEIGKTAFCCGSSVLNQNILLTAAHCFDVVTKYSTTAAYAGHENRKLGQRRVIKATIVHNHYRRELFANDIALALLEFPFKLDRSIQRIALSKNFKSGYGDVAGWGVIDEINGQRSKLLHSTMQYLISRDLCVKKIKDAPKGIICGGKTNDTVYPAKGDSGSAIVKNGFMQVGIVSYTNTEFNERIIVYTDISYFYKWITFNARNIYCNNNHQ